MPQYPPVKGPIQRSLREQKGGATRCKNAGRGANREPRNPEEGQRRKGEHGEGHGQSLKPEGPEKAPLASAPGG